MADIVLFDDEGNCPLQIETNVTCGFPLQRANDRYFNDKYLGR